MARTILKHYLVQQQTALGFTVELARVKSWAPADMLNILQTL